MHACDLVKLALTSTQSMLEQILGDLSDADLTVHPVPGANNIAWQLGHLIACEALLARMLPAAEYPTLPQSLQAQADGKTSKTVPPGGYLKKADYLDWSKRVRAATLATVDKLTDADLDKPTPGDWAAWAPNLGALLLLTANHTLMHAGQFSVTRRALNKPVVF
jgi:hypothetical protein